MAISSYFQAFGRAHDFAAQRAGVPFRLLPAAPETPSGDAVSHSPEYAEMRPSTLPGSLLGGLADWAGQHVDTSTPQGKFALGAVNSVKSTARTVDAVVNNPRDTVAGALQTSLDAQKLVSGGPVAESAANLASGHPEKAPQGLADNNVVRAATSTLNDVGDQYTRGGGGLNGTAQALGFGLGTLGQEFTIGKGSGAVVRRLGREGAELAASSLKGQALEAAKKTGELSLPTRRDALREGAYGQQDDETRDKLLRSDLLQGAQDGRAASPFGSLDRDHAPRPSSPFGELDKANAPQPSPYGELDRKNAPGAGQPAAAPGAETPQEPPGVSKAPEEPSSISKLPEAPGVSPGPEPEPATQES